MKYFINKTISEKDFDQAILTVKEELKKEGFGVLTEIDMKATFKKKIDADFKKYTILGACNPHFAFNALQSEDKLGVLLPCNVIVEEHDNGEIEVSIVDPVASMGFVENEDLESLAGEVRQKLTSMLDQLN